MVQAGDGITVGGAGTMANPYIVAADPADVITVADTPSVNMTKTGNVITSDVIIDPTPPGGGTNLLTSSPDGLSVDCADVRGCVSADPGLTYNPATGVFAPVIDPTPPGGGTNLLTVSPDGLSVDCADVHGCFAAAPGLTYNPATGVFGPDISNSPGNTLVLDPNGLYVPAGGGGGGTIVTGGAGTDVTGTGTGGDPYIVNVDPGCGIEVVAGEVRANVQAWPYPCDLTAKGGGVYCDPATGELRGDPKQRFQPLQSAVANAGGFNLAPGATSCITAPAINVDTTGACEDQVMMGTPIVHFEVNHPAGAAFNVFATRQIDGGPVNNTDIYRVTGTNAGSTEVRIPREFALTIGPMAPGEVHTFLYGTCITNLSGVGLNIFVLERVGGWLGFLTTQNTAP